MAEDLAYLSCADGGERTVRTTCPYCGVGCGVLAVRGMDGDVTVRGDPAHPANRGRLCSKGAALAETLDLEDRLLRPAIGGRNVDWDEALDHVARGFQRVIDAHGPQAVAFYVSGQLLTEDYYVANKLMKGCIGVANIDTNSRLCMSSSVAGHKRAFGADTVPCSYEDLELADLIVLVGSNAAWCHPVLWQRMLKARREDPARRIVVIDPRRTATAADADLFLPIKPGTDVVLFNGLLNQLRREDAFDWQFLESHTEGFADALSTARESAPSIPAVAAACELDEADVAAFYRLFTRTPRVLSLYSQGVNQSSVGTDKVNSIINCHLTTGRIGRPGMGPFSLTGQPNAMGGREVGGLSNQLAAHMDLENLNERELVQRFWQSPVIADKPGLKAVDLFEAIGCGEVKAVWIMATNPVVSLPDADRVRAALRRCELVVVSDCVGNTDTAALANVLLPAASWGEKDGTVTNSERRITRQRPFIKAPGEARPDWWIVTEVARRMGYADLFPYRGSADIFREHAALSSYENDGKRDFDLGGLLSLSDADYDALEPVQWPVIATDTHAPTDAAQAVGGGTARLFGDGRFFHPNRKARLVAVSARPAAHPVDTEFPLVLNTGRVRDHWHTMTRTGKSARLSAHRSQPDVEIHPDDADAMQLRTGMLVRVISQWGQVTGRAVVTDTQRRGSVFVPMHWNDQFAADGRVGAAINPVTDPNSGQPELKHTPVRIEALPMAWEGFLLCRRRLSAAPAVYWTLHAGGQHWCYQLAGVELVKDFSEWARSQLPNVADAGDDAVEWIEFSDPRAGRHRLAAVQGGRLQACVFVAPRRALLPGREWLAGLFANENLSLADRNSLLAGRPAGGRPESGPIVCACFNVGRNSILAAIAEGAADVDAVGECLKAGTNCGSCRPEIAALIDKTSKAPISRCQTP